MIDRAALMTEFVIEAFRLNGGLLAAGDRLVADIGLTSARWQVLGAIELSPVPLPVAHVARNMGLSRQAVQRIANELVSEGLVAFEPNPHHARAKLMVLTRKGARAFAAAMKRQRPWAEDLGNAAAVNEIKTAVDVMRSVRRRLESAKSARTGDSHGAQEHK
jgi:DNA-binding MarR family transcriptional regulator